MDKEALFRILSTQDVPTLLEVLSRAYDHMQYGQREAVFGKLRSRRSMVRLPLTRHRRLSRPQEFPEIRSGLISPDG